MTAIAKNAMTHKTYKGRDGILISADLSQASAPIRWSPDNGETWRATPFQTADTQHNRESLVELIDDWLESEN